MFVINENGFKRKFREFFKAPFVQAYRYFEMMFETAKINWNYQYYNFFYFQLTFTFVILMVF